MDFMIVAVTAIIGAAPIPATPPGTPAAAATVPQIQRHFSDELSCEQAAKAVEAPPGTRLVCVATGGVGGLTAAY